MVLAEILTEKQRLENKIGILQKHILKMSKISVDRTDEAIKQLLELIDKHRSYLILINKVNNDIEVVIGDSKVSLANAIIITKTMKRKVDLIDSMIEYTDDDRVDILDLLDKRDALYDDYITIFNNLKAIEWSTQIDQKSMG